jgi:N-acyl-D-aspartate/D-glutamate deacylase
MATFDLVLRGGTVFDGTGAAGVRADVAVSGEKIAAWDGDGAGARRSTRGAWR